LKPFIPCEKCNDSPSLPKGFLMGRGGEVKECQCHIEWKETEELRIKCVESGLPETIVDKDFSSYEGEKSLDSVEKLNTFVKKFKEIGYRKSLYVHGDNGTQKTTSVMIASKELLKQGVSIFYIRSMDLIVKNFGSFNPTEENLSFIEKAENSDLVVIDECFARKRQESVSDYQLIALRNFLKNRIEVKEKSTIFISNYDIESIQKQGFDRGIYDLIKRNTYSKVLVFLDNYSATVTEFDIDELFS